MADFLGLGSFLQIAADNNFGAVVLGGLIGGLLEPVVAKLRPDTIDPVPRNYFLSPLLGVAAAGISIYVLANSRVDEPLRLLFFALLCGLAFPAVLTSAIDRVGQNTTHVQQQVADIAERARANGMQDTAQAAQDLRAVFARNPPESVRVEGQGVIATAAEQAVANIAQTPTETPRDQRQMIEELQAIGTVAQTAGWERPAEAAAAQLDRLSETFDDEGARDAAGQAAQRLRDGAP